MITGQTGCLICLITLLIIENANNHHVIMFSNSKSGLPSFLVIAVCYFLTTQKIGRWLYGLREGTVSRPMS